MVVSFQNSNDNHAAIFANPPYLLFYKVLLFCHGIPGFEHPIAVSLYLKSPAFLIYAESYRGVFCGYGQFSQVAVNR